VNSWQAAQAEGEALGRSESVPSDGLMVDHHHAAAAPEGADTKGRGVRAAASTLTCAKTSPRGGLHRARGWSAMELDAGRDELIGNTAASWPV